MGDSVWDWNGPNTTKVRVADGAGRAERAHTPRSRAGIRADEAPTLRPPPLPPNERVPMLAIEPADLRQLPLDAHTGFLLSLIDGVTTVEMLLDVCGMPADEALARLEKLLRRGVITMT